jgi:outer membrane receptor protein involved in Fe transport
LNWFSWYPTHVTGRALFGEIYYDWRKFQLTLGLRAYRDSLSLQSLAEGASNGGYVAHDDGGTTDSGEIPKAALAYKFNSYNMGYISASKGFRLGGVSQPPAAGCGLLSELGLTPGVPVTSHSDSVWNYEIGGKSEFDAARMTLTGAIFQMNWSDIQQFVVLPVCYLGITVNQGAARARGGELELSGQPLQSLELRAGIGYNDAKITEQGLPGLPLAGSRIVQIPRVTANLSGTVTQPLSSGRVGFLTADWSYVGDSTSNTAALGYPLTRPSYMLLNASLGVRWNRSELSLYAANLTNQHPNLGDLFSAGFPGHTSLDPNAPVLPRVATLQPFNMGLQYRLRF